MKLVERMEVCVSTRRLLLLCCCFIMSTGQMVCDYNVPEGSSYTLDLGYRGLTIDQQLRWKHNDTIVVRRKNGRFSVGKAEDIDQHGSLKLTDLNKTSSGNYSVEMWFTDGATVTNPRKSWILCVTEKIPKPSVTFVCEEKTVTLTCDVSQPQGLSFKWSDNEEDVVNENKKSLTRPVDQLDTGSRYTCTVSKPSGSETSPPVTPSCHKEQKPNHNDLFGFPFWTMVGILASGGALLLTLMLITICCCSRARRRKRNMLIDEQELRLAWSAPQQQHHHPQNHQHHQQPAGHTGPRQQLSNPAQEPERTRGVVDPDAPKLPKPRGGAGDPSVPKLPKPRGGGGDPSVPKLPKPRGGDPSAPKLPKTRGTRNPSAPKLPKTRGTRDPSAPKLPKPRGGDPSAPRLPSPPGGVPKSPSARASSRLPTAEVTDPCSVDQGAPLGPRPANAPLGPRPANAPLGPRPANAPLGPRPANAPLGPRQANAPLGPQPGNAPLGPRPANGPMGPRPANGPMGPRPAATDEEQPPPLPQARKKVPRNQRGGPDPYAGLR